jgi:hypothetical protein
MPDTIGSARAKDGASVVTSVGGLNDNGVLTAGSRGIYGLRGIGLGTVTVGNQPAAFITSMAKEVRLDSGTQLLLVAQTKPARVSAK